MGESKRFGGKLALVTGGVTGIGRATCEALASEGASVIAAGLPPEGAACPGAESDPSGIRFEILDVRDERAIQALVTGLSSLDILVNGAGVIARGGQEFDPAGFQQVLDVNLTGVMRMCSACRELLSASRGCIVNVGSLYSQFGARHAPAYSASKGGVVQLTRSLALAYAGADVRVNAVMPGWIATDFTRAVREDPERNAAILSRSPLGRWGTSEEVAEAILFLASPAARFITGALLAVDGGYSIA